MRRAVAALAVVLLVALLVRAPWGGGTRTVSAELPSAVSLFAGSDVKIMGVRVGKVLSVTPRGTGVRVEMEFDEQYDVPADAQAIVVSPSVIGDRFVQLSPAYDGGPKLAEDAVIPRERTAVPVELDDMVASTKDLADALGPRGANRGGALSRLLTVAADSLDGTGKDFNTSFRNLARATGTLADASPGLRRTVGHAAGLTGELAAYDAELRSFDARLSRVARGLAAEKDDLGALLESLARSLAEVEAFVRQNRNALRDNVAGLGEVTRTLRSERKALAQVIDLVPLGFTNLVETYDANTAAVRTRANFGEITRAVDKVLCFELEKQLGKEIQGACRLLSDAITALSQPGETPGLPGGPPSVPGIPGLLGRPGTPAVPGIPGLPVGRSTDVGANDRNVWDAMVAPLEQLGGRP